MADLIDSHAHLDDEKFRDNLPAILERALQAEVVQVVTVGTTASSSAACLELAACHAMLSASVAIHPNHVAQAAADDWDRVVALGAKSKVAAVGETGLDRHWDLSPFPLQEDFFARHLELARRFCLPVIIHCREAETDVVRLLREDFDRHGPVRGVMHSFTGDQATAEACLTMGLYLSFAGMVTYKNAEKLRQVAAQVPLERILVETDSPYLAPVPLRGKVNEPANVVHTAACLAGLLDMTPDAFARQSTANARTLFAFTR